ncbi:hypothetical protein OKW41_000643 [Paraburkholderia sp. UCT70]|uniref:aggregation-promoting factor C-terminal-like domain-containing protein n=1 Tax=Paraburkholderia sp. UCT70 TaxID=2991068 RepID=UPI003D21976F
MINSFSPFVVQRKKWSCLNVYKTRPLASPDENCAAAMEREAGKHCAAHGSECAERRHAHRAHSRHGFQRLLWIMAQEAAGVVDARNGTSTARSLFQLLRAQYSLNPRGEASFGNAKEECQGGIRYIYGRYHSANMARGFWQQHHWY